jgi:hypothetical protein
MDCVHTCCRCACHDSVTNTTFDNQLSTHCAKHVICLLTATFYPFFTCFIHFVQLYDNMCVQRCFLPVKHCFSHFLHRVCTVCATHILRMIVTHSWMLYSTSSKNTIFVIFHEKLAQKSSVFIKSMKLFITCVFNT